MVPSKVEKQLDKAGLPRGGPVSFVPKLDKNKKGVDIIRRGTVNHGPKKGKKGYVDISIWVKDLAHAGVSDHWDVQEGREKDIFASIGAVTFCHDGTHPDWV
jgi:hypothetical protein